MPADTLPDDCSPPLFCGPWPWVFHFTVWAIFFAVVVSYV